MPVLKIRNIDSILEGDIPIEVQKEIKHTLAYTFPGYKFTQKHKNGGWDGTITLAVGHGKLTIPTGLCSMVREILQLRGIPLDIEDHRLPTQKSTGWSTEGLILRDYQQTVVDEGLKRQRGVMKCATGAGKTEQIVAMVAQAACFPAVFYVTSCDLLKQAKDRFESYIRYNGLPVKIGMVGAGRCDIQPITIATVQSCQRALEGKYTKPDFDDYAEDDETDFNETEKAQICTMVKEAQFMTMDECQHSACSTIQCIVNNSYRARYRFGCSASPWRDDGLDILIESCFGRRFCDISASFLIKKGFLLKPYITFNHFKKTFGPAATFNAHYTSYIVNNTPRNQWIAQRALYHVSQERPTIILVKWTKHAENLAELIPGSEILTSSGKEAKDSTKRKIILNKMRNRELMCIIGTSLLDEGVDIPSAGAGIFAGGGKSSTRELQRVGRFIRTDKNDDTKKCAYIEEFYDHSKWLLYHAKTRRKILEIEPEFEIGDNRDTLSL